jgi:hypothetical protein
MQDHHRPQACRLVPSAHARLVRLVLCAALGMALAGCSSLATQPAPAANGIAGDWQRVDAASDDFEGKLAQLLAERDKKLRAELHAVEGRNAGGRESRGAGRTGDAGGASAADAEALAVLSLPPEDPQLVHKRYRDDLGQPATLHISVTAEAVDVTGDAEPVRRYLPGQQVSRIDASGTAQMECGWQGNAFVVRASYIHRATRTWRYELEAPGGLLRVSFEASDPEFGKFAVLTRYRQTR